MAYYLLRVKKAMSAAPSTVVLACSNITDRENRARAIFNNKDLKFAKNFGKFDPKEDLLMALNSSSSTTFDVVNYEPINLFEEDDEDESSEPTTPRHLVRTTHPTISIVDHRTYDGHTHEWNIHSEPYELTIYGHEGDELRMQNCLEDGCNIGRVRQRFSRTVIRYADIRTLEEVFLDPDLYPLGRY